MRKREKMISRFLLLMALSCCDCGTLVVNVAHTYQAEENQDVTLEWSFTPKPDSSTQLCSVFCDMFTDHNHKHPILFHFHEGVEVPLKDEEFSGRVQCDKDVLREGRIRLHVSSLRTEDSGWYRCEVFTNSGSSWARCHLTVTAVHEPEDQRPTERPEPGDQRPPERPEPEAGDQSRGRIGLYVGLTAALLLTVCAFSLCVIKSDPNNRNMLHSLREHLRHPIRTS
ncbi:uncharacterized protein LOC117814164 isoform X2 [Notolabrus celidotus]|uniref:uncharacterized protein LOC117814164 isoform X2 n=1 Tax=Notolabrus celidotus TaxID=1203425 RepID=UPI00148FBDC2|nr:uncharacterized protein LOC117814164 isoform X2 [Notolabrus celidotus]